MGTTLDTFMSGATQAPTIGEVGKTGWTTEQRNKMYLCVWPLLTDRCSADLLSHNTKYRELCLNKRNPSRTEASNNIIFYILCWL